jgi:hypothetical protein
MKNPLGSPQYDPRNLQVVFMALLAAQVFFLFLAIVTLVDPSFTYYIKNPLFTIIPLVALAADVLGNRFFQNILTTLTTADLEKSFQRLATAHLVRWAFVEGATFLLVGASIYYNNHFFNVFAAANIIYFITLRPRLFTFNQGLQ